MARIYVKPARPGLLVRRDDTRQPIPVDGAWIERSRYVERRLRDGDLVEAPDPESLKATPKKPAPPKEG